MKKAARDVKRNDLLKIDGLWYTVVRSHYCNGKDDRPFIIGDDGGRRKVACLLEFSFLESDESRSYYIHPGHELTVRGERPWHKLHAILERLLRKFSLRPKMG